MPLRESTPCSSVFVLFYPSSYTSAFRQGTDANTVSVCAKAGSFPPLPLPLCFLYSLACSSFSFLLTLSQAAFLILSFIMCMCESGVCVSLVCVYVCCVVLEGRCPWKPGEGTGHPQELESQAVAYIEKCTLKHPWLP